ncbi:hypothetical protein GGI03_000632 [Coemansia sp. RSA 2337]|nr:hypothetical protein H4S04_003642 [Coemansia sp. S16]KAJ2059322.1 hypothetical protein GGI08_003258 [Coemansia sp. S2]KAJ2347445.1 hypothetical protein GGH92_003202 [Coemansia sp. RSA 2673]KAJ2469021.1 hypothetical protein GGI03_000632 [Coemansia sp. RSA 2337]
MANRTVSTAEAIHGTNPQFLMDKIFRQRIYNSLYWKEHCFGLTVTGVMEKAVDLQAIGREYGESHRPTEFACLLLKLLQLQPDQPMLDALIDQEDFKYLRALALFYYRLTQPSVDIYTKLEPLYRDYRKLREFDSGSMQLTNMDQLVDALLTENIVYLITLPHLTRRMTLEDAGEIAPRISPLDDDDSDSSVSE